MANPTSKLVLATSLLVAAAAPSSAQEYYRTPGPNYSYLSRSDSISLSAGEAPAANIAIQTPTPWPWYVKRTTIATPSQPVLLGLKKLYEGTGNAYGQQQQNPPATDSTGTQQ